MSTVNQFEKIPNNVNLGEDRRLQRALETWQPDYLKWWLEMGPDSFQKDSIYLRTAISVEPSGWAHFDYVKMPDYRWGIFLAPLPFRIRRLGLAILKANPFGPKCRVNFATGFGASSSLKEIQSRPVWSSSVCSATQRQVSTICEICFR